MADRRWRSGVRAAAMVAFVTASRSIDRRRRETGRSGTPGARLGSWLDGLRR